MIVEVQTEMLVSPDESESVYIGVEAHVRLHDLDSPYVHRNELEDTTYRI